MRKGFIGSIVFGIVTVYAFFVLTIYYTGVIEYARAEEQIRTETSLFLDKVADTKEITKSDLEDFTLAMASSSIPVTFEIRRGQRQVNPDPASTTIPKKTHTTWVLTDDIYEYDDSDTISVEVKQIGSSFYQTFSARVLNMYISDVSLKMERMVR